MMELYSLVAKMFPVFQKLPEKSTSEGLLSVKISDARVPQDPKQRNKKETLSIRQEKVLMKHINRLCERGFPTKQYMVANIASLTRLESFKALLVRWILCVRAQHCGSG